MYVYADHAATTEMSEVAKNSMIQALKDQWGNPSSLHSGGQHAKEALEAARAQIAGLLGAQSSEIYFTSGGSEADNSGHTDRRSPGRAQGQKAYHHLGVRASRRSCTRWSAWKRKAMKSPGCRCMKTAWCAPRRWPPPFARTPRW